MTIGKDVGESVFSVFKVAYIYKTPKLEIDLDRDAASNTNMFENDVTKKYRFTGGERGSDAGTIVGYCKGW